MIEVAVTINASLEHVWEKYTSVEGVEHWAFASSDWAAEGITNDVRPGGTFKNRNFAKDGSMEFMFEGTYTEVVPGSKLAYTLGDGRKVEVTFTQIDSAVKLDQRFEPETQNPEDQQQAGWQAYLDNFKKYAEAPNAAA